MESASGPAPPGDEPAAATSVAGARRLDGARRPRRLAGARAGERVAGRRHGLDRPGLFAFWVDDAGAADLSRGLDLPLEAGRIYAGQAGATKWPSGRAVDDTLGHARRQGASRRQGPHVRLPLDPRRDPLRPPRAAGAGGDADHAVVGADARRVDARAPLRGRASARRPRHARRPRAGDRPAPRPAAHRRGPRAGDAGAAAHRSPSAGGSAGRADGARGSTGPGCAHCRLARAREQVACTPQLCILPSRSLSPASPPRRSCP